jgi:hypothetical protein
MGEVRAREVKKERMARYFILAIGIAIDCA